MATPDTLGESGRAVWAAITSKYDLRADELLTLENACAATDMIAELESDWSAEGRPKTARGSTGQLTIHPLIGEIRAQRADRDRCWRQLKLPDDAVEGATNQNRAAGQSRWAAQHGAGA